MGAYEYQALDAKGKKKKGVATGDSARLVRAQLREQGLAPLSVEAVEDKSVSSQSADQSGNRRKPVGNRKKFSNMELAVITRQFSTLLGSGLTV